MFGLEDKGTWKCPSCGTSWRVETRSYLHCYRCGEDVRSYTLQVRALLAKYFGAVVSFDYDPGRKGRRKKRSVPMVATYEWLCHNPKVGFMMDVRVLKENGKRVGRRSMRIPLRRIKPWGPLLEQTIKNLDLIVARSALQEGIFHLPEKIEAAGR